MGKVISKVSHPFRNFNVESRAHKIISKEKPIAAPKYKNDPIDISQMMRGEVKLKYYFFLILTL